MAENLISFDLDSLGIKCYKLENPELCKVKLPFRCNFKVITFNIRSISKNFDDFFVNLTRFNISFDVIILTECWLREDSTIPQIPNYMSFKSNKMVNQNSGVVVYVSQIWNALVTEPEIQEANCLKIVLENAITILGIYRSPSYNPENFISSLDTVLHECSNNIPLLIAGDMNINILHSSDNVIATEYLSLTAEHGLAPAITVPTRNDNCIDHIFVRSNNEAVGIVCSSNVTDHDLVLVGLTFNEKKIKKINRLIIKRNVEAIRNEIKLINWDQILQVPDVNKIAADFTNTILEIVNKHTSTTAVSQRFCNIKPWITPGLIRCMRHRDRLHSQTKRNPHDEMLKIIYKRYRNFCNNLLRKLKIQHERKELERSKGNTKKQWKVIKNICNLAPKRREPLELLNINGTLDENQSLQLCNSYFATAGKALAKDILLKLNRTQEMLANEVKVDDRNNLSSSFFMQPTDVFEVEALISKLENDKASGIDGIGGSLIKQIKDIIIEPLTLIFNSSMSTGIFPDIWKLASITPVYKSGPRDVPGSYRPISLLGIFSKLLEKIVNKRLQHFLNKRCVISERQFGFRRGKSTEEAVSLLTSTIASHLDRRRCCIGVFLDLAKAFDTVSIPILVKKLENVGIRGTPLEWFKSYLTDRKQCVKVGKFISSSKNVEFGVPQGSILGPTLFILYINGIHSLLIPHADIICYADDTAIVFDGNSWSETINNVERGMRDISDWLQLNLLTLNTSKTKFVCFFKTLRTSPPTTLTDVYIHSCQKTVQTCGCGKINRANVIRYLGVLVDQQLNFKDHIEQLSGRVRKITYIMRQLRDVTRSPHLKYFKGMKTMFQELEFIGARCKPPSQEGFIRTLKAVERLFLNLESQYDIQSLSTRRLNQDPLENCFGCIRSNCGYNPNPNTLQFVAALKTSMINNLLHSSKNKNCIEDDNVILNDLKSFLTKVHPNKETNVAVETFDITEGVEASNTVIPQCSRELQACAYVCGFMIKKLGSICHQCKITMLADQNTEVSHLFTSFKEYNCMRNSLHYVNNFFTETVEIAATFVNKF
ncbi:unnamed protein product [Euphydryas editha]|uniref:Reverse transcriptase domain-containing protein n=1 Tax=Euphydryas editha TaxID=104508 RepID=A0AAU9TN68_EUPED|nr:unnamed protein product [Euphydryas editha]